MLKSVTMSAQAQKDQAYLLSPQDSGDVERKNRGTRGGEEWHKELGSGYVIAIALMISQQPELAAKDLLV